MKMTCVPNKRALSLRIVFFNDTSITLRLGDYDGNLIYDGLLMVRTNTC